MKWPAFASGLGSVLAIVVVMLCVLILLGAMGATPVMVEPTPLVLVLCVFALAIARLT